MEIVWSERKRTVVAVWVVLVLLATAFVFALANGAVDYYVLSILRGEGVSASSFSMQGITKGTSKLILNKARLEHRINHQKKGAIHGLSINKRSILESEQVGETKEKLRQQQQKEHQQQQEQQSSLEHLSDPSKTTSSTDEFPSTTSWTTKESLKSIRKHRRKSRQRRA